MKGRCEAASEHSGSRLLSNCAYTIVLPELQPCLDLKCRVLSIPVLAPEAFYSLSRTVSVPTMQLLCTLRSFCFSFSPLPLGRKLFKVIIDVDLKELSPLSHGHFSEHGMRTPVGGRSCTPGSIQDFKELLFFEVKVELRVARNLESFWQSQTYRLLGKPVD